MRPDLGWERLSLASHCHAVEQDPPADRSCQEKSPCKDILSDRPRHSLHKRGSAEMWIQEPGDNHTGGGRAEVQTGEREQSTEAFATSIDVYVVESSRVE